MCLSRHRLHYDFLCWSFLVYMSFPKRDYSHLAKKTVTLPVLDVLNLALGHSLRGTRDLPSEDTAEVFDHIFSKGTLFKVQFFDTDGSKLSVPVLWSYPEWHESTTNYKRLKAYQDKQIEIRAIERANIKIIKTAIMKFYLLEDDETRAEGWANLFLKKKYYGTIKNILGIKKLITTVEEII